MVRDRQGYGWGLALGLSLISGACGQAPAEIIEAPGPPPLPVVLVGTVSPQGQGDRTYTGRTQPQRQVTLRSQVEGQLLSLAVAVGDPVQTGQTLGQLDGRLLVTAVEEAQAELAARQFEVARAEAELADMRTAVATAAVRLQQARNDAQRLAQLAVQGAVAAQQAEQAETTLRTAEQAFQATQEQLRTRQQGVAAAQQRVAAQRSLLREAEQRLTLTRLQSPLSGTVLEQQVEPGDLVRPGEAIFTLGDLANLEVAIEVADLHLGRFRLGQPLTVRFDALPGEVFSATVGQIAPLADPRSRLVPIQLTLPNPDGRLGSGLLARVTVPSPGPELVLPQTALEAGETQEGPEQIFLVEPQGDDWVVTARPVQIRPRSDGQVAVLAGLRPGDRYVQRSSEPLQTGKRVQISLASDP